MLFRPDHRLHGSYPRTGVMSGWATIRPGRRHRPCPGCPSMAAYSAARIDLGQCVSLSGGSSMGAPKYIMFFAFLLMGISGASQDTESQRPSAATPVIPKTWDDAAIATLEVPLVNPVGSPKHVSAEYYYRIP